MVWPKVIPFNGAYCSNKFDLKSSESDVNQLPKNGEGLIQIFDFPESKSASINRPIHRRGHHFARERHRRKNFF
jgi:hypothetical protein